MSEREALEKPFETVGVMGLGGMGRQICLRYAKAGRDFGVTRIAAFDADASTTTGLSDAGVTVCASVAELTGMADLVLLCLSGSGEVGKAARSHEGLLDSVKEGQVIVDHSWSSVDLTRQLATAFTGRDAVFIDAPIGRAQNVDELIGAGTLAFAIGGKDEVIDAIMLQLRCFGGDITKIGPVGSAQVARHLGDLVALQTFSALVEALTTARAFDVDANQLLKALANGNGSDIGIGRHGMAAFLGVEVDDEDERGRTSISEARGRLEDVIRLAKSRHLSLGGAGSTLALLDKVMASGQGEGGMSALFGAIQPEPDDAPREPAEVKVREEGRQARGWARS